MIPLVGRRSLSSGFIPNTVAVRLFQQQTSHDESYAGDNHRVIEAGIDIAGFGNDGEADQWQQPTKHAVAYVIGQRKRRIANLRRESLNQVRGDGTINQANIENLNEYQDH